VQARLHVAVLHGRAPQGRINAVQFGGVDDPLAVLVLGNGNPSGIDGPQNRGLVPADRSSGCRDGVHGIAPTVPVNG
jgi:hypothetical protein